MTIDEVTSLPGTSIGKLSIASLRKTRDGSAVVFINKTDKTNNILNDTCNDWRILQLEKEIEVEISCYR